jgi:hypothetical protein
MTKSLALVANLLFWGVIAASCLAVDSVKGTEEYVTPAVISILMCIMNALVLVATAFREWD